MRRKQVREEAFKTLFMMDLGGNEPEKAIYYTLEGNLFSAGDRLFLKNLVLGTREKISEIDDILSRYLVKWEIVRLAAPIRSILRMAVYEMLFAGEVPVIVAINEAIELAKRYQDEEAARFVNGILDKIRQEPWSAVSGQRLEKNSDQ